MLGSVERMIAILTEHFGGKWPLWLSPRQVMVIPLHESCNEYAVQVAQKFVDAGFYADAETSNKKFKRKIAEVHHCLQHPHLLHPTCTVAAAPALCDVNPLNHRNLQASVRNWARCRKHMHHQLTIAGARNSRDRPCWGAMDDYVANPLYSCPLFVGPTNCLQLHAVRWPQGHGGRHHWTAQTRPDRRLPRPQCRRCSQATAAGT